MSLHHFYLSIPANTSSYIENIVSVEAGIITQLEVYYPQNNKRFAMVWFIDGSTQILPREGELTGNGNVQTFQTQTPVNSGRLSMRGINTDTTYDHDIDAWVVIEPYTRRGVRIGF